MHENNVIPYPTITDKKESVRIGYRHIKMINLLSKVAADIVEPVGSARIASCITFRNEVISFGINELKSHPFQAKWGKNKDSVYLHAEISAIKNALKIISPDDLTRSSLYICRVKFFDNTKKKMIFGLAKPCCGCFRCITTFNLRSVIYTLDNEGIEQL